MCSSSTCTHAAPEAPPLRVKIPADAAPSELADVVRAFLDVPGVAECLPELLAPELAAPLAAAGASGPLQVLAAPFGGFGALAKALKPGGPAHRERTPEGTRALSAREVSARQSAAEQAIAPAASELVSLLSQNLDSWLAAVELSKVPEGGKHAGQLSLERLLHLRGRVWNTIERDARSTIREAYRALWMQGRAAAGNFSPMSPDEEAQLTRMQRTQASFWLNLLRDAETGAGTMPLGQRVRLYGAALRQAFYAGRVLADLSPDVYFRWESTGAESCPDCLRLARSGRWRNGTFSAVELARLGIWPGSGHTRCLVNCKCQLVRVARPTAPPQGRMLARLSDLRLLGPSSASSFQGAGRQEREIHARAVKRYKWNHGGTRRKSTSNRKQA